MKIFVIFLIFAGLAACTPTRPQIGFPELPRGDGRLIIDIKGLRNDDGEVFVSVFTGKEGFPDDVDAAVVNRRETIRDGRCRIVIEDLPFGAYAVSVLHDENRDGVMNTGLFGVPKEGFGFSGNPKTRMGPPEYEDSRFLLLVAEKRLDISMRYETLRRERQRIMQERKTKDKAVEKAD